MMPGLGGSPLIVCKAQNVALDSMSGLTLNKLATPVSAEDFTGVYFI